MFIKCSYDVTLYVTEYEDYLASKEGDIYESEDGRVYDSDYYKGLFYSKSLFKR